MFVRSDGGRRTAGGGRWPFARRLLPAVRLLVIAALLATAWLGFFFYRDNFATTFPLRAVAAEAWRSGEIPFWNGLYNGGQPLAGNPSNMTFYPSNVLYLVLPVHVAFNLHYLLHVALAWLVMRALCRARGASAFAATFAASVYALSGVVISATSLYNHIVNVAMVPLALLAVERRSAQLLGVAFGLMALAAEPVVMFGAVLTVAIAAFGRVPVKTLVTAALLAVLIASPLLIAFYEISGDAERTAGLAPANVLATALSPLRIAELFVWPFAGDGARMFPTIFVGLIALPALVRRSRYVAIVLLMLFLAAENPIVTAAVTRFEWLRIGRYPEKFVIPLTAALVVLIGEYVHRTRFRRAWLAITFVPLLWSVWRHLPIDWFSYYRLPTVTPGRIYQAPDPRAGDVPVREEYRRRARNLDPLHAMPGGVGYLMLPSPDAMDSRLTQVVTARFHTVPEPLKRRYLQIHGARVPGALPMAMVVPRTLRAASLHHAVRLVESSGFDPRVAAVAPVAFTSAPARVTRYVEDGQTFLIDVEAQGEALVLINQTFYAAWVPTMNGQELPAMPLNIDRLGVVVPGSGRVVLRFGRYRAAVTAAAALSFLLVFAALAIEVRQRRAGEVERPRHDDR